METMSQLNREVDAIEQHREKRAAYRALTAIAANTAALVAAATKSKVPLKELLTWRMCSDPWPGGDMPAIDEWLNSESRATGFLDWIDAYHQL